MHLSEVKQVHDIDPEINTDYFLKTHLAVEAATLRLGLIALRLQSIPYEQARKTIRSRWIRPASDLKKILDSIESTSANRVWSDYGLERLAEAFKEYSSKYRNKVLHAAISEIYDQKELALCIEINVSLLRQLEKSLRECFDHSLFDTPASWGAKVCRIKPEITVVNAFGGKANEPITYEAARSLLIDALKMN
jgi:hypothetical protein